jgi:hypothetical protein
MHLYLFSVETHIVVSSWDKAAQETKALEFRRGNCRDLNNLASLHWPGKYCGKLTLGYYESGSTL